MLTISDSAKIGIIFDTNNFFGELTKYWIEKSP